jgi:hypothetical protein
MEAALLSIVSSLLASSEDSREVSLDALGEAIGARAVTADEIEEMIDALERAGRRVVGKKTGSGVANLRAVLDATRALGAELGRLPTRDEIAARSGLSSEAIAHALALARIMQR